MQVESQNSDAAGRASCDTTRIALCRWPAEWSTQRLLLLYAMFHQIFSKLSANQPSRPYQHNSNKKKF